MIIIDELGTGTDPEQGGALSCSILRRLNQIGTIALVSTHLGMLKAFAHSEPGMINSAMEMEEANVNGVTAYKPTYKLLIGEPGTSHALEIAGSLGLQVDIIREARRFITDEDAAIESLISELKQKTRELDSRLKETERMKEEAEELRLQLKGELSKIKSLKKDAYSRALSEAEEVVRKAKKEALDIINVIKKSRPSEAGEAVKVLNRKHIEIQRLKEQHSTEDTRALNEVKEGQHVFIKSLGIHGTVNSINEKSRRCTLLVDGKEIVVPLAELWGPQIEPDDQLVSANRGERPCAPADISIDVEIDQELNVVGQRVDPSLSLIERFLNDAVLSGLKEVKIIHGIGAGILSRAVRDYLKGHPLVESLRPGNEEEGGDGVTVITL